MKSPDTELKKFIKHTPLSSIENFFSNIAPNFHAEIKWDNTKNLQTKIAAALNNQSLELQGTLLSEVERVTALTDELGQYILYSLINDDEVEVYSELENEFDRSLWTYLNDQERFRQAEDIWYADDKRDGQMWGGYCLPKGLEISKDSDHMMEFKKKSLSLFRVSGNIEVDIFERKRPNGKEEEEEDIIQIMVFWEDLPSTQFQFKQGSLISTYIRPVKEIAIIYDPKCGVVEIVAEGKENRENLVKIFCETLLQANFSGEKIPVIEYNIQQLLRYKAFSVAPEDGIDWVKVTMLKIVPPNSNNRITLEIPAKEMNEIYDISKSYFGDNDPLKSGFKLKKVRICIKFKPDHESRRGKPVYVELSEPNGCNLKSKTEKERLIGEKYLKLWGLVKEIA